MSILSIKNLTHQFGNLPLFEGLSLSINTGDRIGLVGHNGCGKSTVLKLILNPTLIESGSINQQRGLKVGIVEQFIPAKLQNSTLYQCVLSNLSEEQQQNESYKVDCLLQQLGFNESVYNRLINSFSGGQQNLILFARAIILEPELLLLDEPSNHMDSQSMWIIKQYLSEKENTKESPTFLMISHDRDLLDSVTNRTIWIRDQQAYEFNMPYSQSKDALLKFDEDALKARNIEQKEIGRLKVSATRFALWGQNYDSKKFAKKAKTLEKKIDKLEDCVTKITQGSRLKIDVDTQILRSKQIMAIESTRVVTPNKTSLFDIEQLVLKPSDRVALLGENGCGKSSFIKLIVDATIYNQNKNENVRQGFKINPNVKVGYFDQQLENFEENQTIFNWVKVQCKYNNCSDDLIKRELIGAGFSYLDHSQCVQTLSGGEKARLMLVVFQLDQPNFLIMDEPTNHIDLQGKEELETSLIENEVSLLFTSHDQAFINNIATRFLWIKDNTLTEIHDVNEYINNYIQPKTAEKVKVEGDIAEINNEDELIDRLIMLEALLENDLARKEKFQKVIKQKQWMNEIETLKKRLF